MFWLWAKKCPRCGAKSFTRQRRKPWMKLVPFFRRYSCDECDCLFVTVCGLVLSRTST